MEMGRRCWVLGQSRLIANRNKEVRKGKVRARGEGRREERSKKQKTTSLDVNVDKTSLLSVSKDMYTYILIVLVRACYVCTFVKV